MLCTKQNLSKLICILNTLAEVPVLAILTRSSLQSKEVDCDVNTVFCKQNIQKRLFFPWCHTRVLLSVWNQSSELFGCLGGWGEWPGIQIICMKSRTLLQKTF